MAYSRGMQRLTPVILIVATVVFDLFVLWAIAFTVAWGGAPSFGAVGFWLFAASPVIGTAYCIRQLHAVRRGGNPRI